MKTCPMCGVAYDESNIFCPTDGAALWSSADGSELVNTVIADRYLIVQQLGEGGMGRVYLAKHVRLPQQWAIKVLHPALVRDPGALARFNQEAANAGRIENPHVARVIDFGETPSGLIYLAMEYVEGEPLSALITREGNLPPSRAAEITRQVADALTAAHELGIVHRDLKPDNIMVGARRGGGDDVKVVDFGIAKVTQDDAQKVTQTGFVIGTPEYMSPEQIHAATLDGRSDVYSLALVTFNMLTGQLPFPGATPQEGMLMRLASPPRTLAEARPDIAWPPEVQAALGRALAREAADRYPTAIGFAHDLGQAIAQWQAPGAPGAPATTMSTTMAPSGGAPAASAGTRPRKRVLAGITAASTVLVLGAAAVLILNGRRTERAGTASADSLVTASTPPADSTVGTGTTREDSVSPGRSEPASAPVVSGPDTQGSAPRDSAARDTQTRLANAATRNPSTTPPSNPPAAPRAHETPPRQTRTQDASGTSSATPPQPVSSSPPASRHASAQPDRQPVVTAPPPATTTSAAARQALDRMARLVESLSESGARTALGMTSTILPTLRNRGDSVEALYYTLQANLIVGDIGAACRIVHDIHADAQQTKFAAAVQVFSDSLPCR